MKNTYKIVINNRGLEDTYAVNAENASEVKWFIREVVFPCASDILKVERVSFCADVSAGRFLDGKCVFEGNMHDLLHDSF